MGRIENLTPNSESTTPRKPPYQFSMLSEGVWNFKWQLLRPLRAHPNSDTGIGICDPEKDPVQILNVVREGLKFQVPITPPPWGASKFWHRNRNLWPRESPRTNFQYCRGGLKFQVLITLPLEAHPKSETGFGIYTLENAPHQIWSGYKVFCENMVVSVVLGRHRVIACVDKYWRECQTNWCNKPSVRVGVVEILIATVVKVWGKHGHQGLRISISLFFRSRTSKKGSGFDLGVDNKQN